MHKLKGLLEQIEGKGYKAYKALQGTYDFQSFRLSIDHVQGDPFAQPSRISLFLTPSQHGIPGTCHQNRTRKTALEDFIGRQVGVAIGTNVRGRRGTGRSGDMEISTNGQQIIRRNAVLIDEQGLEVRLLLALPGSGRSILVDEACVMLFQELPAVVSQALSWRDKDLASMRCHVDTMEDQSELRKQLRNRGAVAFVADGSVLPRKSGVDDQPLSPAIPFSLLQAFGKPLRPPIRERSKGCLFPKESP